MLWQFRKQPRIVDFRSSSLQGPALYICSDKPLASEDIRRMQRVNRSEKRIDFLSCGRFGVGLNVMYRYSDCPQLLANGRLHFFDLTRSFVAEEGRKRGKQFDVGNLQRHFPDTWRPFSELSSRFPVIFRLALRKGASELAGAVGDHEVQRNMQAAMSSNGAGMLLFCKSLESLTFKELASGQCTSHRVGYTYPSERERQSSFFRSLASVADARRAHSLDADVDVSLRKFIVTCVGDIENRQEWAIVHRATGSDEELRLLSAEFYNQDHGFAVLPYASAAARVDVGNATEEGPGYVCCGLPTPERSGSPAWINGSFIFTSSRKHFPLPEGGDQSSEKRWNLKLLQGPAAWCLKELLLIRRDSVATMEDLQNKYFRLLPESQGGSDAATRVPAILAEYALRAGLHDEIFPEVFFSNQSETGVRWVRGPHITLTVEPEQLSQKLQARLATDGLQLVHLPDHVRRLYVDICAPHVVQGLSFADVCRFLQDLWQQKGHETSARLDQTGILALQETSHVLALLAFVQKGNWQSRIELQDVPEVYRCDHLLNVPLLLRADESLCTFGTPAFSSGHGLLKRHQELFVHPKALKALQSIPLADHGIRTKVTVAPQRLRPLKVQDLQEYRAELEAEIASKPKWADNDLLKQLWSLMQSEASTIWGDLNQVLSAVWSWEIFPVDGCQGPRLASMGTAAAQTLWPSPDFMHISAALASLQFKLLQYEFAEAECHWMVTDHIISTPMQLLESLVLLQAQSLSDFNALPERHRHDLLAFLAVLCIQSQESIEASVRKLPLFKLAMSQRPSRFTALGNTTGYCCIKPDSPGIATVEAAALPGTILLAWPTAKAEPIYKHCGVGIYDAESYVRKYILPALSELILSPSSERIWDVLHMFIVQLGSPHVIQEIRSCAFVPARSGRMLMPTDILDWEKLKLVECFNPILRDHLPSRELQVPALRSSRLQASLRIADVLESRATGIPYSTFPSHRAAKFSASQFVNTAQSCEVLFSFAGSVALGWNHTFI